MVEKDRTTKKEQFVQPEKNKIPVAMMVVAAMVIIVAGFIWFPGGEVSQGNAAYFGEPVAAERSYVGQRVAMTVIEPEIVNEEIRVPLSVIENHNIVAFEIENDQGFRVPLMAYITPSGRLFVGSSMCEPCRGRSFSLAGATLLCDKCNTTYDIENHAFLRGSSACGQYPPVNMNPRLVEDTVILSLPDVLGWRIRA